MSTEVAGNLFARCLNPEIKGWEHRPITGIGIIATLKISAHNINYSYVL